MLSHLAPALPLPRPSWSSRTPAPLLPSPQAQLEAQKTHFTAILDALRCESQQEAHQLEKAQRQLDSTTRQIDELMEKKTEYESLLKQLEVCVWVGGWVGGEGWRAVAAC